ncbi:MAG: hypothetical protein AB7T06_07660 [Kofleriaceae bacterium]
MATDHEPRPVPKLLIWGLVGGFILFAIILVVIVLGRDRGEPQKPQSSESRSESPPQ